MRIFTDVIRKIRLSKTSSDYSLLPRLSKARPFQKTREQEKSRSEDFNASVRGFLLLLEFIFDEIY